MRFLVAPVLVLSTLALFGSGVALLAVPHRGAILGLHKASFIVWFGAMTIHVLSYTPRALRHTLADLHGRLPGGNRLRLTLAVAALAAGVVIAIAHLPARTRLVPRARVRARRLSRRATSPGAARRAERGSLRRRRREPGGRDPADPQRHPAPLLRRRRARQP